MSENEQTAPPGTGQPLRGEHAAGPASDSTVAGTASVPGASDVPWTPPPRRARAGGVDETLQSDSPPSRRAAGGTDRRARAGRRSGATGPARSDRARGAEADQARPVSSTDIQDGSRTEDRRPRRAWALWAVIGGAVAIVVAAVVAFAMLSGHSAEPAAETVTTTMAVPTPTSEPLDRSGATALVQALPATVRQFVLTTVDPVDSLDGALEAWTAGYSGEALREDGSPLTVPSAASEQAAAGETAAADLADEDVPAPGDTEGGGTPTTFTVTVGQWEDAERATAGAQALAADLGEPTTTDDVTVAGEVTGSLAFYAEDAGEAGATGTAVWTNGTVAIRAVGPASEIANFATAFGL